MATTSNLDEIFPARLKELRIKMRLTQEGLADLVETHSNTIARYESGNLHTPKRETLRRLARALNTTTSYLLGETDDPSPHDASNTPVQNMQNIGNVGGANNVGNVTVNATTEMKQADSVPLWVTLPQAVYNVVQKGNPQEIDATLDATRAAVKVLEQAKATMA